MRRPLVLYSTNTWLAYSINERYYRSQHYVWCAARFMGSSHHDYDVPPTSTPAEIYNSLAQEVRRGDRHSSRIQANKVGILRGASLKEELGVINRKQIVDIDTIVKVAETADFRPLVYVIPYTGAVSKLIKEVPVADRAHPLSDEYIIECLPRACFDIIEF